MKAVRLHFVLAVARLLHLEHLHPGEGASVIVFAADALLIMLAYYVLKTIREPLLLVSGSAETKSYAYAVIALVLLLLVPAYAFVFHRTNPQQFTRWLCIAFIASLLLFLVAGSVGMEIGFSYYVWVGVFSVLFIAHFWAFAADCYSVGGGERAFPLIMIGATVGSLAGPVLSRVLYPLAGPWPLMGMAAALLAITLPLGARGAGAIPPASRGPPSPGDRHDETGLLAGLHFVVSDRYLSLLALLILVLNWVNTTGEYILADLVIRHADTTVLAQPGTTRSNLIAAFYGNYFLAVNIATLLVQLLLVARIMRWAGVAGALFVLPLIVLAGYGLIAFVPVFSIIQVVKIIENATDYSLMNTTRHALYLPLSSARTFKGKTTIEGFFWRLGDLIQAGVIYVGLHMLEFRVEHFALLNMLLAVAWLWLASRIGVHYARPHGPCVSPGVP